MIRANQNSPSTLANTSTSSLIGLEGIKKSVAVCADPNRTDGSQTVAFASFGEPKPSL